MNQKIIIMKLKHKILTLIAGTLTTFALTSCNDFLDRDPKTMLPTPLSAERCTTYIT